MLHFDIDTRQLQELLEELQATTKQVRFAMSRALRRTATTLRKLSAKGLKKELQLRTLVALRKRLKMLKLRSSGDKSEISLWYGLNDLPVSSFKGRVISDRTRGAVHLGANGMTSFGHDAFAGKSKIKGKQTIFKRKGHDRLPIVEQLIPIEDQAIVYLEDEVLDQTLDIFWNHFERDLRARVKYNLGRS